MTKPLWLLDVDGVVNVDPGKPGWHAAPRKVQLRPGDGKEYVVRWAPMLVARIRALHATGLVDIRWASSWIGQTAALARVTGLPDFEPAYDDPHWDGRGVNPHTRLKLSAALDAIEVGRPLIWTEDEAIPHYMLTDLDWGALGVLLIAPQPNRGLLPEHMDAIEDFALACASPAARSVGIARQTAGDSDHPKGMTL